MTHKIEVTLHGCMTALAALLCFGAALGAQAQELRPYNFSSAGFRVSFPAPPKSSTKGVDTEAGKVEMHLYSVDLSNTSLFVATSDFGISVAGKDPNVILDGARQGALSNTGCHQISSKTISLDGYRGVEFEGENQTAHLTARIYMVDSVLYQVMVATPLGKPYPYTTRFLNSFKLIPRSHD